MRKIGLVIVICIFIINPLFAQQFNDVYSQANSFTSQFETNVGLTSFPVLLIPMGGLYESMATAFTAVSSDSSFIESNPAASSILELSELSLLHNNWIADSNIEGAVFTTRIGDAGLSASAKMVYVPFTEYNTFLERVAKGPYIETYGTLNASYNLFSSYYFYGIAVGANIKAGYRSFPVITEIGQSAFTIMADLGFITRLNFLKFYYSRDKNFSVGATIRNLGPDVMGDPLPSLATGGIAYSPIRPVIIAVDFTYPFVLDLDIPAEHWCFSGGISIAATDYFKILSGLQYPGAHPRLTLGSHVVLGDWGGLIINYTLDLTTQPTKALNRVSIETKINLGDQGRKARQQEGEKKYIAGLEAYARGDLVEAITLFRAAIALVPSYQPAKEALETAEQAVDLQTKMENLQQLQK